MFSISLMYILYITCLCSSSIFTFRTKCFEPVQIFWSSTKFFEPVQMFLNQYKFFNLSQSIFGPFDLLFIFPLFFISTLLTLTYYSLPALPTSQSTFFLSQCLPCKPWTTALWFSFGFMFWYLTSEPWRLGCKFPLFLITYTQYW